MRIECCCNIEDAPIAHAAGFDFIECRWNDFAAEARPAQEFLRRTLT